MAKKKKTKKKNKTNKLTPKQLAFIREYIKDHNGSAAAVRAGYSEKTAKEQASQLLTKLNIKEAIEKAQAEAWDAAIMGRREALKELSELARKDKFCLPIEPDSTKSVRIKAIEALGKMRGYNEPEKHEHTVTPEDEALEKALEKKLDSMSADELLALLEKMEGEL